MACSFIYQGGPLFPLTGNGVLFHLPSRPSFSLFGQWSTLSFTVAVRFISYRAMERSFIYRRGPLNPFSGNGVLFHLPARPTFSLLRAMERSFIYRRGDFFPLTGNGVLFHLPGWHFFPLNGQWCALSFTGAAHFPLNGQCSALSFTVAAIFSP